MPSSPDPLPDPIDPFEDCSYLAVQDLLARQGFHPRGSLDISAFDLPGRLLELIYALAGRRIFLTNTDHLDDRALYDWLISDYLLQIMADIPPNMGWSAIVDPTESEELDADSADDWKGTGVLPDIRNGEWTYRPPVTLRDPWLPSDRGVPCSEVAVPLEPNSLELSSAVSEAVASSFPPHAVLPDGSVTAKLWELLHEFACREVYFRNTDPLPDRLLYTVLRALFAREEATLATNIEPKFFDLAPCANASLDPDPTLGNASKTGIASPRDWRLPRMWP